MADGVGYGAPTAVAPGAGTPGAQATISTREIISYMAILLNDLDGNVFRKKLRVWMFNRAQEKLMDLLPEHFLRPIQAKDENLSVSSDGTVDLNDLTNEPAFGEHSLTGIQIPGGKYYVGHSFKQYQQMINRGTSFVAKYPICFFREGLIYLRPVPETKKASIEYLRAPREIAIASVEKNDVQCEFDNKIIRLIIGLSMEEHVDRSNEATRAFNGAISTIEMWKRKYSSSRAIRDSNRNATRMGGAREIPI